MATEANKMHRNACSLPNGCNKEQALPGFDDRTKTARHPRWTRQETLVLIQGKKVVESRTQEGHRGTSADKNELKWDSVSSYCRRHGVNREPVQCQKRWNNLLVDFKKIKTWESQKMEGVESFWIKRNDVKKVMKLPSLFDKEVYEVLEGGVFPVPAIPLTLVTNIAHAKNGEGDEIMAPAEQEQEEEEDEAVFGSSQHSPAGDGFFSNFEPSAHKQIDQSPVKETIRECLNKTFATPLRLHISEKKYQPFCREYPQQQQEDTLKDKYPGSSPCTGSTSQESGKRRRLSLHVSEDTNMGDRLIKILERNSSMLNAQLEVHSIHCQLDREQRKEHSDSLIAAVNKLTDATQRIIDKLQRTLCNKKDPKS